MQNLHTHTKYCDGMDTPEELILYAIEKGFTEIGFSGHSYASYSPLSVRLGDHTEEYKADILSLKEKYKGKIDVFLGLEVEMFSKPDMSAYDYLIGSVHYLECNGEYVGFDEDANRVEYVINTYFGGDGMKYAKAYYENLAQLPQYGKFDIIGHFDLITKHCEKRIFFDVNSKEYIDAALQAVESLKGKIPFFELNTGAIARGYRTAPYPAIPIIKELKRQGFGVVITSDCHNKKMLDCWFDDAAELLRECGYTEKYILTTKGFEETEL